MTAFLLDSVSSRDCITIFTLYNYRRRYLILYVFGIKADSSSSATITSALAKHNTRHTGAGKFRIWGTPLGLLPGLTLLESSRRALIDIYTATYFFRDIRSWPKCKPKISDLEDPLGACPANRGEDLSGTEMYHRAKFHAARCHRRRDISATEQRKNIKRIPCL